MKPHSKPCTRAKLVATRSAAQRIRVDVLYTTGAGVVVAGAIDDDCRVHGLKVAQRAHVVSAQSETSEHGTSVNANIVACDCDIRCDDNDWERSRGVAVPSYPAAVGRAYAQQLPWRDLSEGGRLSTGGIVETRRRGALIHINFTIASCVAYATAARVSVVFSLGKNARIDLRKVPLR
jgi:hypothetical protein